MRRVSTVSPWPVNPRRVRCAPRRLGRADAVHTCKQEQDDRSSGRRGDALDGAALGVQVIQDDETAEAPLHASGHPAQDDLRDLYEWVRV